MIIYFISLLSTLWRTNWNGNAIGLVGYVSCAYVLAFDDRGHWLNLYIRDWPSSLVGQSFFRDRGTDEMLLYYASPQPSRHEKPGADR